MRQDRADGLPNFRGFWLVGALFLLFLVIAVPSRTSAWFDGLPWTTGPETLLVMVFVPAFLILGWRFLLKKWSGIFLLILVSAKLLLVLGAPADGWSLKIYPTEEDYKRGVWIETYATLWAKETSGLFIRPWLDKRDFPLEWAIQRLTSQEIWRSKFGVAAAPVSNDTFHELRSVIEISGSIKFKDSEILVIVADGVVEGSVELINNSGQRTPVKLLRTGQSLEDLEGEAITGEWNIQGALTYFGGVWSLKPMLITEDGSIKSAFDSNSLFRLPIGKLTSAQFVRLFHLMSYGYSVLLISFFASWFFWLSQHLIKLGVLSWPIVLFSGLASLLSLFTEPLFETFIAGRGVNLGGAPLGLALIVGGGGLFVVSGLWPSARRAMENNIAHTTILLFGPAMFMFYALKWWSGLDRVTVFSLGDDWTGYQLLAFRIAVWGEVLSGGGEPVFYYQPLYRYVVALFHWLFGKSFVPQQLFDVWCILGAAAILASFVRRFNVSTQNALLASTLYIVPVLIGPLRHHIGRGLSENTSMIFLVLAAWWLVRDDREQWRRIVVAGIFGVLGYWTRLDHLLITFALVFLLFEPVVGTTSNVWCAYKARVLSQWKPMICYLLIIAGGFLSILLRNWILSGQFVVISEGHPNYVFVPRYADGALVPYQWQPIYLLRKLQLIVAMKPAGQLPSPFAAAMILGTISGLVALFWRPKILQAVPVAIGLALVASFISYYFVHIGGYPPRFSIHILPIATASFVLVLDQCIKLARQGYWYPTVSKGLRAIRRIFRLYKPLI